MGKQFSRRTFIREGSGLAVCAAAGWRLRRLTADERPQHGLRKALKYGMIRAPGTIAERFEIAKNAGFEGVDMTGRAAPDEVKRAQDQTGLIVHGVVGYDHWKLTLSHEDPEIRKQGLDSLKESLRDAKAYGATSLLIVPAVVNKETSYDDAYRRSQTELKKLVPLAEDLGIQLLIENVWNNFLLSPLELTRYLDELNSPMVGSYFDVGNVVRYAWPEQWIRILGKRIKKLDIKEYSRKKQMDEGLYKGFDVKIGDGDCDWPAVMQALRDIGFRGWATAEVPGGGPDELREIAQRMDKAFS